MRPQAIVILFALLTALLVALPESHADCRGGVCRAPVRKAAAGVAKVARAAVALPVRAAQRTAAFLEQYRPVRRSVRAAARGAARVATAPVRAVQYARRHRGQCR